MSTTTAWCIALGCCLIFVSDLRLAREVFLPLQYGMDMGTVSLYVRGPFLAGWVLLAVAAAGEQPLMGMAGREGKQARGSARHKRMD